MALRVFKENSADSIDYVNEVVQWANGKSKYTIHDLVMLLDKKYIGELLKSIKFKDKKAFVIAFTENVLNRELQVFAKRVASGVYKGENTEDILFDLIVDWLEPMAHAAESAYQEYVKFYNTYVGGTSVSDDISEAFCKRIQETL